MQSVLKIYDQSCDSCQSLLNYYVPAIPKDFIKNGVGNLAFSFTASTLLSYKPTSGVIGGSFALTATVIHAATICLFPKFEEYLATKGHSLPSDQSDPRLLATVFAFVGTYCIGHSLELPLDFKATSITTLSMYILNKVMEKKESSLSIIYV